MTDSLLKALERGEVPVALVEEELERERRATIDECAKIAESGAWAKYADGRRSPTKCVAIAIRALVEEELKGTADMSDDVGEIVRELRCSGDPIEEKWAAEIERLRDERDKAIEHKEYAIRWANRSVDSVKTECFARTDEACAVLRRYMAAYPAFRIKPIGAPGSPARIEQENLMALEEAANAVLARVYQDDAGGEK